MELKKALELQVSYYGSNGTVRVDEHGYICLNDLASFFPNKEIKEWLKNKSTAELLEKVNEFLNRGNFPQLKTSLISKRGRHKSGTFAHELVAMDFAAWLSVEFKLHIYQSFINGTQRKENWNIKRILAANNYKMMAEAIKNDHEKPMPYHYSNEALMLNEIVFGLRDAHIRDLATEEQLDKISALEQHNATMILLGMDYQSRKEKLTQLYNTPKQLA